MRNHVILGLLLAALVVPLSEARSADKKPLVVCGTTWGKLGGDSLPGQGYVPDLVMKVFRHAGYQITTKIVPWSRCIALAKTTQFDLVAAAWRGKNFEPHFDYLNVIAKDTINFITTDNSPIQSGKFSEFRGKKIGMVRDVAGLEEIFKESYGINVTTVSSLDKLPAMLNAGRFEAIVTDPVSLNEAIKTLDRPFTQKLKVLQPALKVNLNSPLIAKHHPNKKQLAIDFDRSYRALVAEGLYEKLAKIHDLDVQKPD